VPTQSGTGEARRESGPELPPRPAPGCDRPLLGAALAGAVLESCAAGPRLPGPREPHAVVRLVVRHHSAPGTYLDELVRPNGVVARRRVIVETVGGDPVVIHNVYE
jgi:hypothetical protein